MTYLQDLHRAHLQRQQRLSDRAPEAGPLVIKPKPRVILLDEKGKRVVKAPPSPPVLSIQNYPPMPPLPPEMANTITVGKVMFAVMEAFNLPSIAALKNHRRIASVVRPRQVAMYLARDMAGGSFPMIARLVGGYDHTTVMYAVRIIPEKMQIDPALAAKVQQIKQKLVQVSP